MGKQDIALRVAAKAVIVNDKGQVLIVREAPTYGDGVQIGRYGLPGGRIEAGERFMDGLLREVREETGLDVSPLHPVLVGEWRPTIKGVPHQIIAVYVVCKAESSEVRLSEEHDGYEWVTPKDRSNYDIVSPDWEARQLTAQGWLRLFSSELM